MDDFINWFRTAFWWVILAGFMLMVIGHEIIVWWFASPITYIGVPLFVIIVWLIAWWIDEGRKPESVTPVAPAEASQAKDTRIVEVR